MFAEVVLKRKLPAQFDTLTYQIPQALSLQPGQTVICPFGKSRVTGVVTGISSKKPEYTLKDILGTLSEEILLSPWQLTLAKWISEYYFSPLSKVIPLFLPKKAWNITALQKTKKSKIPLSSERQEHIHTLTEAQKEVLEKITKHPREKFLLHGVTGSGKTEIYLRLAKRVIEKGSQVLFLVPEIALTPQLIDFIKNHFPETPLTVIHSKLTEKERDSSWISIFHGETKIVVGSRSALFSPFQKLGLIILDEEHEWTYKQEQTPRYHARKVVEKMAELTGATLVLGSATPDVETYYEAASSEAKNSKLLELHERIAETPMPKTEVIDLREELKKGNFSILSDLLREKIAQTLAQKKQAILFLNRRGTSPALLCRDCGYVAKCEDCEVAMVMHRLESGFILLCHHCGKRVLPKDTCPDCNSHRVKGIGIGTERVEEEIKKLFSLAKVYRADRDTIQKKSDYDKLYEKLKNHEIDILVGTQIIAKGLDLPQVHLIGVILADTSLHFPDFRSSERTFQLITQVSGRAGRRKEQGEVIIQTYNPDHFALQAASRHDYHQFYEQEIAVRRELGYPPFSKCIRILFNDENIDRARREIVELEEHLNHEAKKYAEKIVIVSCPAMIPKLHGKYHFQISIRGEHPEKILTPLLPLKEGFKIDVDPM